MCCGASTATRVHPRFYGSFPRVLGRYVREQKIMSWEEAIRKMSGLPASTIGMVDRGFIALGMAADITVFDAECEWTVDPARFRTKGRNTPYAGRTLTGRVECTIVDGRVVHTAQG